MGRSGLRLVPTASRPAHSHRASVHRRRAVLLGQLWLSNSAMRPGRTCSPKTSAERHQLRARHIQSSPTRQRQPQPRREQLPRPARVLEHGWLAQYRFTCASVLVDCVARGSGTAGQWVSKRSERTSWPGPGSSSSDFWPLIARRVGQRTVGARRLAAQHAVQQPAAGTRTRRGAPALQRARRHRLQRHSSPRCHWPVGRRRRHVDPDDDHQLVVSLPGALPERGLHRVLAQPVDDRRAS